MTPHQEQMLNELHTAIVGNPAYGQSGLVSRVKKLEDYKDKDQTFKHRVAGGIAVGTPVLVVLWTWLRERIIEVLGGH